MHALQAGLRASVQLLVCVALVVGLVGSTPAAFRAMLQSDLARWEPVIRKNQIRLD